MSDDTSHTLTLDPKRYTLTMDQVHDLVGEFGGKVLEAATMGDEDDILTIEFSDQTYWEPIWDATAQQWTKKESQLKITVPTARAQFDLALIPFRKPR